MSTRFLVFGPKAESADAPGSETGKLHSRVDYRPWIGRQACNGGIGWVIISSISVDVKNSSNIVDYDKKHSNHLQNTFLNIYFPPLSKRVCFNRRTTVYQSHRRPTVWPLLGEVPAGQELRCFYGDISNERLLFQCVSVFFCISAIPNTFLKTSELSENKCEPATTPIIKNIHHTTSALKPKKIQGPDTNSCVFFLPPGFLASKPFNTRREPQRWRSTPKKHDSNNEPSTPPPLIWTPLYKELGRRPGVFFLDLLKS